MPNMEHKGWLFTPDLHTVGIIQSFNERLCDLCVAFAIRLASK